MHDNERRAAADELIESTLRTYADVEPAPGFETRMAARVREAVAQQRDAWWKALIFRPAAWATVAAALVLVAVLAFRQERTSQDVARTPATPVVQPQTPEQPRTTPATVGNDGRKTMPRRRAPAQVIVRAEQTRQPEDSFFTHPASVEERRLMALTARNVLPPPPLKPPVAAEGEPLRPSVAVAPVAIRPLPELAPVEPTPAEEESSIR